MYKIPDTLYSWAKPAADEGPTQTEGGIILPGGDSRPGLIHFSRLLDTGIERSWLWLSANPQDLVALRMLPDYAKTPDTDLIKNTLPRDDTAAYLQVIDTNYLKGLPLSEFGIQEIWLGFNFRQYASSFDMPASCDAIMDSKGFSKIAAR